MGPLGRAIGIRMDRVLALLLFFPFVFWCPCSSSSRFSLHPFTLFSKILYFCHSGKSKSERCGPTANFAFLRDPLFWAARMRRTDYFRENRITFYMCCRTTKNALRQCNSHAGCRLGAKMGALRKLIINENNGSRDAPTADYPRDADSR